MLWAKLFYRHTQTLRQRLLLTPVAIRRVQDGSLGNQGRYEKLAIGFVQTVFRQLFEAEAIIAAWRNRNSTHAVFVPVIEKMLEERVSHPRSACEIQVSFVFVEYETTVVNYNNLPAANVLQFFYTRQLALGIHVCVSSVRRYGNVGVYDIWRHCDAAIRLFSASLQSRRFRPFHLQKSYPASSLYHPTHSA